MQFCRSLSNTDRHIHCWLCTTLQNLQYPFGTQQMQVQSASAKCFGHAAGLSLTSFKGLIYLQYMFCSAHVNHPPIVLFGCAHAVCSVPARRPRYMSSISWSSFKISSKTCFILPTLVDSLLSMVLQSLTTYNALRDTYPGKLSW